MLISWGESRGKTTLDMIIETAQEAAEDTIQLAKYIWKGYKIIIFPVVCNFCCNTI